MTTYREGLASLASRQERRRALLIRDHAIGAVERAEFYRVVRPHDLAPNQYPYNQRENR